MFRQSPQRRRAFSNQQHPAHDPRTMQQAMPLVHCSISLWHCDVQAMAAACA